MIRGLVLAGGKSSRFGQDKALALYQGVRFLDRAVSILESVDLKPIVVTRRGADYPFLKYPVLYDKLPDQGPLGGIYTAMTVFKNTTFLILTCDMPALTSETLRELLNEHEPARQLTCYSTINRAEQPFPAIYEPSILKIIREKIIKNDLSMTSLFREIPLRKVINRQDRLNVFSNMNTQEDLRVLSSAERATRDCFSRRR